MNHGDNTKTISSGATEKTQSPTGLGCKLCLLELKGQSQPPATALFYHEKWQCLIFLPFFFLNNCNTRLAQQFHKVGKIISNIKYCLLKLSLRQLFQRRHSLKMLSSARIKLLKTQVSAHFPGMFFILSIYLGGTAIHTCMQIHRRSTFARNNSRSRWNGAPSDLYVQNAWS